MATIQEKTEALLHQRTRVNEIEDLLKKEKATKNSMQVDIMSELTKQGFNSVKIGKTTVSKAIRKTMQIINEKELIKDLKSKGLGDYISEQIDKNLFKGLSTSMVKDNKVFEGTEIKESEYISIRTAKK